MPTSWRSTRSRCARSSPPAACRRCKSRRPTCARIAALDDAGPSLGAVIELNPDAETIARDLDDRFRSGGDRWGRCTACPCSQSQHRHGRRDGHERRLARARASIARAATPRSSRGCARRAPCVLGKTNLSEWANFRSTNSTSGWSSLGGQTRNPYVLDRNPCGSSSGSAVAVAARLAPLAVGTETDGSIVCPAAANGVVGIKPAIGTVSQRGIVPIAHSQDTAGPLARTVADAALLLSVLAGARCVRGCTGRGPTSLGYASASCATTAVRGATRPSSSASRRRSIGSRRAGVVLVDPVAGAGPGRSTKPSSRSCSPNFATISTRISPASRRGPRTLDELIAFNAAHATEVMPFFGQELLLAGA